MEYLNPNVSIIMGVYNCESTLVESIESIINQSYKDWELIMCDDCSRDNTYEIAKSYEHKYPDKIIVLKNEKNLTLGPTLNKCIEYTKGKYIARQDGDDISLPNRLKKQIEFLEMNKEFDLVGTGMIPFDERGEYGTRIGMQEPNGKDLMSGSKFAHATIMIKANVLKSLNGYCEKEYAYQVEDYDLWFRFFSNGYRGFNIQEALYKVREDKNAYKRKSTKRRLNEIRVMLIGRKRLSLPIRYNISVAKPMITIIIPKTLLKIYHQKTRKVN